ncbi:MAG: branched-chain amino acid aminotransferase [Bacteroidetes bacterium]|nr:branched-chain amino acid aminotransferase [Bacteroidota bacterium]
MELLTEIAVRKAAHSKIKEVNFDELEFGKYVSDHMLVCDYSVTAPMADNGWDQPMVVPFSNLSLSPAALALHYGQTVFEGMKAFRMQDGRINIFRMERHYERFARSLQRMCMAIPPREIFVDGLVKLIEVDQAWVPDGSDAALYLRPFMYASEAKFGIKIADEYRFVIFTGPVNELFSRPLRVKVETEYVRAAKGGTGAAKCGGNYGGALFPTRLAREMGYDQVLWTDAKENRFIEESGSMNVMFVINDTIITPPLSDSILDGVTRDTLLVLAEEMGYAVAERPVSVEELEEAFEKKTITEAFGAGTAAVVAPIQMIGINGNDYTLPAYGKQSLHETLKRKLHAIRTGREEDKYGWNYIVG